mmetsp:Transcript_63767/g.72159  ORF Transcript_63767/g.72159 Transcript_63767/m.72159 type:complete len:102 (-) Transcript_63767:113-418(-)
MTFVVLEIGNSNQKNSVDSFFLSAPDDLVNRIVNESAHNLGSKIQFENTPYGTTGLRLMASTSIRLYQLLNWIEYKGYELHSVLPMSELNGEKYIFHKKTG